MPLVNSSLPNLIQGVSQQPDPLRYEGQCTEQINGYSSIVEGLVKRPNTRHVAELKNYQGAGIGELKDNTKVHFIDTRSDEKYAITIEHNDYVERLPESNWSQGPWNWDVTNATVSYNNEDPKELLRAIKLTKDNDSTSCYITRSGEGLFNQGDTIVVRGYVKIGELGNPNNQIKGFRVGNPFDPESFVTFTFYPQEYWYPFEVVIRIKEESTEVNGGWNSGIRLEATDSDGNTEITDTNDQIFFAYVSASTTSVLSGYNLETGASCFFRVNGANGVSPYPIPEDSYLNKVSADELDLQLSTVGDTTFIVNPNKIVGLSNDRTPVGEYPTSAFVYCKQGDYSTNYRITLRGNFGGANATSANAAVLAVTVGTNANRIRGNVILYSYYIQSVTIVDGGTGYSANKLNALSPSSLFSVSSSDGATFKNPLPELQFSVNPTTGAITSVTVLNKGLIHNNNRRVDTVPSVSLDVGNPTEEVAQTGSGFSQYAMSYTSADSRSQAGSTDHKEYINTDTIIGRLYGSLTGTDYSSHGESNTEVNITPDFYLENTGNLLRITPKNPNDFSISVGDGAGNNFLGLVFKEVDSITDLPTYFQAGYIVKVRGNEALQEDDYYVKFVRDDAKEDGVGNGSWVETVAPNVTTGIDNSQAPMKLELFRRNTFNLDPIVFADRLCGDDFTNPHPSFTGREIRSVFYFKDRIGFLIDDGVVLSEQGIGVEGDGYIEYNFYRSTVTTVLDSDPIDVVVNSNKVINLRHAEPLQDRLLLFSDGQQFSLEGGAILSGSTVSISPTTALSIDTDIKPNLIGGSIYFPFKRGNKSGVTEYQVDVTNEVYTGNEVTQQVPRYIDGTVKNIEGSSKEEVLVLNTNTSIWETYVNKWYLQNNNKILNSWFKFKQSFDVKGYKFIESDLYMIGNMPYRKPLPNLKFNANLGAIRVTGGLVGESPQVFDVYIEFEQRMNVDVGQEVTIQLQDFRLSVPASTNNDASGYILYENKNPDPDVAGLRLKAVGHSAYVLRTSISIDDLTPIGYGNTANTYNTNSAHAIIWQWDATSHIIKMPLEAGLQDPNGVNVLLDSRIEVTLERGTSIITLPYQKPELGEVKVVTRYGVELPSTTSGNIVTLTSPVVDDVDLYVGITYKMFYQFSELIFKMPQGNSKTPTNSSDLMVRKGSLYHTDTNNFTINVTPHERPTITSTFDATTESGSFQKAGVILNNGFFKFPVVSSGEDTEITLEADGFLPASFQSAEFESFVKPKSNRYG